MGSSSGLITVVVLTLFVLLDWETVLTAHFDTRPEVAKLLSAPVDRTKPMCVEYEYDISSPAVILELAVLADDGTILQVAPGKNNKVRRTLEMTEGQRLMFIARNVRSTLYRNVVIISRLRVMFGACDQYPNQLDRVHFTPNLSPFYDYVRDLVGDAKGTQFFTVIMNIILKFIINVPLKLKIHATFKQHYAASTPADF